MQICKDCRYYEIRCSYSGDDCPERCNNTTVWIATRKANLINGYIPYQTLCNQLRTTDDCIGYKKAKKFLWWRF